MSSIPVPRYIPSLDGATYTLAPLRYCMAPRNKLIPEGYALCLVGEQESVKQNLQQQGYVGKPFIHFDEQALATTCNHLSETMKQSIRRVNCIVSRSNTSFNMSKLSTHTLGLVPLDEVTALQNKGYGKLTWYGIGVYSYDCSINTSEYDCKNQCSSNYCYWENNTNNIDGGICNQGLDCNEQY